MTLAHIPPDIFVAAVIVAILLCAVAGLLWAIFAAPSAAERLEQEADDANSAQDTLAADMLAEFRDSQPAVLAMLRTPPEGASQYRRDCDQLGLCNSRAACSACPQRPSIPHQQPTRAEQA